MIVDMALAKNIHHGSPRMNHGVYVKGYNIL